MHRAIPGLLLIASLIACTSDRRPSPPAEPRVRMVTPHGDMVFEILSHKAPITAANFLRQVDEGRYESAHFYRTVSPDNQPGDPVKIEVIQGGLGSNEDATRLQGITHETTSQTGVLHLDGTLSMARAEVGTATSEFFICIGPQPELDYGGARNPDGQGFAAFGHMVTGQDVARSLQGQPARGQDLNPTIPITRIVRE